LGVEYGSESVNRLDLDDHLAFDNEVGAECGVDADALVQDRDLDLTLGADAAECQLVGEACLLGGFEESRSHRPMDFDRRADD
jgi:hypothetical protein